MLALPEVEQALSLQKQHKGVNLTGLANSAKSAFCISLSLAGRERPQMLLCVATREDVRAYKNELEGFFQDLPVMEYYPRHLPEVHGTSQSLEIMAQRTGAMRIMRGEIPGIVLATAEALLQRQSSPKDKKEQFGFAVGETLDKNLLLEKLVRFGYERVDKVDGLGQFAVRGGILDIFVVGAGNPVRLEWLDESIESMRYFDMLTQRSISLVQDMTLISLTDGEDGGEYSLFECCAENTTIILDEPNKVWDMLGRLAKENNNYADQILTPEELEQQANKGNYFAVSALPHGHLKQYEQITVPVRNGTPYSHNFNLLHEDLDSYLKNGITPIIMIANTMRARSFADNLGKNGLPGVYSDREILANKINIVVGNLSVGFRFWNEKWVFIAENDIFGVKKRKSIYAKEMGQQLQYFTDIKAGDYVVHSQHGIGRYEGVVNMEQGGGGRTDYLLIIYAEESRLYVPVDQVGMLHKYVGGEGVVPRLSRMGGGEWQKIKAKAAKAITILAEELLRLYAQRQMEQGHAFAPDNYIQEEFENAFPFEETPDQLKAIREIKADMESTKPMERLLCGDVGYGKTEVALRAAFKAVMDGKQVAVLAPTTVLTQQHYLTFTQRMGPFGPKIALLNRFTPLKEQTKVLEMMAAGDVDVVIGTHRLLSRDVIFKDLGLLIIDEEQRFGVAQKEKIKRRKVGIDVLALSATPIPRTLHMALVNGRDMSTIDTPPEDRLPVETFVLEYDEHLIKEVIERELRRDGQIFYVHNRIEHLAEIEMRLHRLVPGLRIVVGHGQMPVKQLEEAVMEFYSGECDLLLCTTIVENGLDVPRANTIIIDGADRYGLSQLYQMRGRVGRSSRLAYAYFFYRQNQVLSEVASKRLQAIHDFTELGSGLKIAMRDLEIRGAGNILGSEQHGHIAGVGFHEYCQMLEETINRLKTGKDIIANEPQPVLELHVDAYISDDYIDQPRLKMDVYRHLAELNYADKEDYLKELEDRFGKPPEETVMLWRVSALRALCRKLKIRGIHVHRGEIKVVFAQHSLVNTEALVRLIQQNEKKMQFTISAEPVLIYKDKDIDKKAMDWLERELVKLM